MGVKNTLEAADAEFDSVVTGTLRRDHDGRTALLSALAGLYVRGVPVDWAAPLGGIPASTSTAVTAAAPVPADRAEEPEDEGTGPLGRLARMPEAAAERTVLELIGSHVAALLNVASPDEVAPGWAGRSLGALGFTSLLAVELRDRLIQDTGLRLPRTLVFDHPVPRALARFLAGELRDAPAGTAPGRPAPEAAIRATAVSPAAVPQAEEPTAAAGLPDGAIAIVGLAARLPGARDLEEYWDLLRGGREAIARFDDEELAAAGVPEELIRDPAYVKAFGALHDAEMFDAAFFGLTPRRGGTDRSAAPAVPAVLPRRPGARRLRRRAAPGDDRRLRWRRPTTPTFSTTCWAPPIGAPPRRYFRVLFGNDKDYLATRVAYKLDLKGPSLHRPDGLLHLAGRRPPRLPGAAGPASATSRWRAACRCGSRRRRAICTRRARILSADGHVPRLRRRRERHGVRQRRGRPGAEAADGRRGRRRHRARGDPGHGDQQRRCREGRLRGAGPGRPGRGHRQGPGRRRGRRPARSPTWRRTARAPRSATRSRWRRSPRRSATPHGQRVLRDRLGQAEHRPPRRRGRRGRPDQGRPDAAAPHHRAEHQLPAPEPRHRLRRHPLPRRRRAASVAGATERRAGPGSAPSASAAPTPTPYWRRRRRASRPDRPVPSRYCCCPPRRRPHWTRPPPGSPAGCAATPVSRWRTSPTPSRSAARSTASGSRCCAVTPTRPYGCWRTGRRGRATPRRPATRRPRRPSPSRPWTAPTIGSAPNSAPNSPPSPPSPRRTRRARRPEHSNTARAAGRSRTSTPWPGSGRTGACGRRPSSRRAPASWWPAAGPAPSGSTRRSARSPSPAGAAPHRRGARPDRRCCRTRRPKPPPGPGWSWWPGTAPRRPR